MPTIHPPVLVAITTLAIQGVASAGAAEAGRPPLVAVRDGSLRCGAGAALFSAGGSMSIYAGSTCLVEKASIATGLDGYTASSAFSGILVQRTPGRFTFAGSLPGHPVRFTLEATPKDASVQIRILRDGPWAAPLPWCAFHLELPVSIYAGTPVQADGQEFSLPKVASSLPALVPDARRLVFAPGNPQLHLEVDCASGLQLRDGRSWESPVFQIAIPLNLAPAQARTETTLFVRFPPGTPAQQQPRLCVSPAGYSAAGLKEVTLEWFKGSPRPPDAVRIEAPGGPVLASGRFGPTRSPGHMQYDFASFSFPEVRKPGRYRVVWDAGPAREIEIKPTLFTESRWAPTLDWFFPWQMCHADVRFPGSPLPSLPACHLDDAQRVPAHFSGIDGFQSYEADRTPFAEGGVIPCGTGGWHDAGDYDLNVHAQAHTTWKLALTWEEFRVDRDRTTVDLDDRRVIAGQPDGLPDLLQQVQWGATWLLAMQQPDGLVYPGVCGRPDGQYTAAALPETLSDGRPASGDERHLYVDYQPASQLAQVISLAAAARVLGRNGGKPAQACLAAAEQAFAYYRTAPSLCRPNVYFDREPGDGRAGAEAAALAELYLTTGKPVYLDELELRIPALDELKVGWPAAYATACGQWWYGPSTLARLVPVLPNSALKSAIVRLCERAAEEQAAQNSGRPWPLDWWHLPDWGASGHCLARPFDAYYLERAAPGIFKLADTQRSLLWIYGYHPQSEAVFVCLDDPALPTPKFLYNGRIHGRPGGAPTRVPGAVVPGMSGIEGCAMVTYHDAPGNYSHNEACIYTAADYLFAVHALKSAGY